MLHAFAPKMHQNIPFPEERTEKFSGRGVTPSTDPTPLIGLH